MFGGQKILGNFNSSASVQIGVTTAVLELGRRFLQMSENFSGKDEFAQERESSNDLVVGVKCSVFRMWAVLMTML